MSSTDNETGFPDNPLSPFGIVLHVVAGIFVVPLLLFFAISPVRPTTLSFKYFLFPDRLVQLGSSLEATASMRASHATWFWPHGLALFFIIGFYVAGPMLLIIALRAYTAHRHGEVTSQSPWLTALTLAAGVGLTFFAVLGPLVAVPQTLLQLQRESSRRTSGNDREILMADMELMALRAQAKYHRAGGWLDSAGVPLISDSMITPQTPTLQSVLHSPYKEHKSRFVVSVAHRDTLIIYGTRGEGAFTFDRKSVMQSCADGKTPPGLIVTPLYTRRNYG